MKMSRLISKLFVPCFLLFTIHCSLFTATAQTATATLSGTIQDENAAVIPGVEVSVKNYATAFERHATTNESGQFTVPLLPPGTYTVTARRVGFSVVQVPDVVLNVGDQKSLSVELRVGDVNAAIEVRPDESLVSTSASVGTTIDKTFVSNLPLNGRSFSSLVLLTPGVTIASANSQDPGQFSVNGMRSTTNYFVVDGVSVNSAAATGIAGAATASAAGAAPAQSALGGLNNLASQDSIQEFRVLTSTYTAESGRQPGAQVQVITRSGENTFHGSLFDYVRNEAFDARNYFNQKPQTQTPLRQNNFGGTFSGPLPFLHFGEGGPVFTSGKDRTFFFFSYEGQRLRLPKSGTTFVPSLRVRESSNAGVRPVFDAIPQPTGAEITTTSACTQPVPPAPPDPTCAPNGFRYSGFSPVAFGLSSPGSLDATSIRIDHSLNSRNSIFGRYNDSPSNFASFTGNPSGVVAKQSTRSLTLGVTSTWSESTTNEARLIVSRDMGRSTSVQNNYGGILPVDPVLITGVGGNQGGITVRFGTMTTNVSLGDNAVNKQEQLNIVENLTIVKGSHLFKFGVDYRRLKPTIQGAQSQTVTFRNELSLRTGIPSQVVVRNSLPVRLSYSNYSFFAQDTWKATRRLTLDLGVRYELNPAPSVLEGPEPIVVLGIANPPDVSHATLAPSGTPFWRSFKTAFAPRFGAAYRLRNQAGSETVLRGGVGIYYDLGSTAVAAQFPINRNLSLPNAQYPGCPAPITFPLTAACSARPPVVIPNGYPVTINVVGIAEDLRLPKVFQWSVGVEQSINRNGVVSVSYVGSAGRDLLTSQLYNQPVNGVRPNPNFTSITFTNNRPTSDYHSLQAQYRTRLLWGVQALANYTWSHAIDEVSSDLGGGNFERGNADFDVRHNFSAAVHYDIPMFGSTGLANALIRNWSLDAIVHAQTGRPLNVFVGSIVIDGESISVRPNYVQGQPLYLKDPTVPGARKFNSAAFSNPASGMQGNFGRNVLRELPISQIDLAVARTFTLRERLKLRLKWEVFNAFNHPMFGQYGPQTNVQSSFGVPATTLNNSLGGLNPLYQLGGPRSMQLSAKILF